MKTLVVFFSQFILFYSLGLGSCLNQYDGEIANLGNSGRSQSLKIVADTLRELNSQNSKKDATLYFSRDVQINPRSLQNIIKRADKRGDLCRGGFPLGHQEIGNLIKAGKLL